MKTNIRVEVHRLPLPTDITLSPNYLKQIINPIYRLYVDDDLITERNWIWDYNIVIDENLYIDTEIGSSYTIKVECLKFQPKSFELKNLRVNGSVVSDQTDLTKLRFTME